LRPAYSICRAFSGKKHGGILTDYSPQGRLLADYSTQLSDYKAFWIIRWQMMGFTTHTAKILHTSADNAYS
jgi:hypothetical protein